VEALPDFVPNNTFDKDQYDTAVHDYVGSGMEFNCCLIKPGNRLCNQPHDWGYVVRLKDGTLSIVGHECIFNDLQPDSHIWKNIAQFRRDRDHRLLVESVERAAKKMRERIPVLDTYLEHLSDVQKFLHTLREKYGDKLYGELVRRAKTTGTNFGVFVAIKEIEELPNKKTRTNRRRVWHNVGSIRGIALFEPGRIRNLRERIEATKRFYSEFAI